MAEDQSKPPQENSASEDNLEKNVDKPPLAAANTGQIEKKRNRKPLSCFERWTVILGCLGILVAAGTGIAIVYQAKIGAHANKIALRAMESQTRPWIGIGGEYYKPYPIATFNLVIRNYGQSPAVLAGEPIGEVRQSNKPELRYWRAFFKEDICGRYERFPMGRRTELPRIRIPVFQGKDITRPISKYLDGPQNGTIADLWVCVPYGGSDGIPKYQISVMYLVDFAAKTVKLCDSDFGNAEAQKQDELEY
jgi:hypothetical protein